MTAMDVLIDKRELPGEIGYFKTQIKKLYENKIVKKENLQEL